MKFTNKVAIVTGAAGGIGLATTKKILSENAKVLMVGRHEQNLKDAINELDSPNVAYIRADVTNVEDTKAYVQRAVEVFGGVDILFSNAGILGAQGPVHEMSEDNFEDVMRINVRGVFLSMKYCIPEMLKRGKGSIVITSSTVGLKSAAFMSAYCASKYAVIGLMKSCVQEVSSQGIRVNCINPGPIDNRMMESMDELFIPEDSQVSDYVPLGRYGTNEEVANLVSFLASDDGGYCNGGCYCIDGGMIAT